MSNPKELQEAERAGREAGRRECLDFLGKEDEELSRRLEAWLIGRGSKLYQRKEMLSTTSINDSLTPDLFYNIFKRLDSIETTRIRRVCKRWFEIIDEHQSFWRALHLPEDSIKKWDQSILELFDRKSGSTLQDLEIGTEVKEHFVTGFLDILQKSKETLKYLLVTSNRAYYSNKPDLLNVFIKVECLRLLDRYRDCGVRLRRKPIKRDRWDPQEAGANTASPLRVLWNDGTDRSILGIDSDKFKNLVSLASGADLSASEWRTLLEGCSQNLKHLRLGLNYWDENDEEEDQDGIPSLFFPNLEVLELVHPGDFPQWLLIPDSAKLIAHADISNLPSISELWSWKLEFNREHIINQIPKLRTFCQLSFVYQVDEVLEILKERRDNVEAGLQVNGVKMEMIKTLILPFSLSQLQLSVGEKKVLRGCRELVEVIEGDSQLQFIEVEV